MINTKKPSGKPGQAPFSELEKWIVPVNRANLNNDTSLARLKVIADKHEVGLIIFDTWSNTSGVEDENAAALNAATLEAAVSIRPEAATMFVHHPRKSNQDDKVPVMRGSGALDGRADVVMTMFRDDSFVAPDGQSREWLALSTDDDHAGKNRTAETETITGLHLQETGSSPVMRQEAGNVWSKGTRKVLPLLGENVRSAAELAQASGVPERTVRNWLKAAVEEGAVKEWKDQGRTAAKYQKIDQPAPIAQPWKAHQKTAAKGWGK